MDATSQSDITAIRLTPTHCTCRSLLCQTPTQSCCAFSWNPCSMQAQSKCGMHITRSRRLRRRVFPTGTSTPKSEGGSRHWGLLSPQVNCLQYRTAWGVARTYWRRTAMMLLPTLLSQTGLRAATNNVSHWHSYWIKYPNSNQQISIERSKSIKDGCHTFLGSGRKGKGNRVHQDDSPSVSPTVPGPRAKLHNDIKQQQLSFLDVRNLETPEPIRPSSSAALFKPVTVEVMGTEQNSQK